LGKPSDSFNQTKNWTLLCYRELKGFSLNNKQAQETHVDNKTKGYSHANIKEQTQTKEDVDMRQRVRELKNTTKQRTWKAFLSLKEAPNLVIHNCSTPKRYCPAKSSKLNSPYSFQTTIPLPSNKPRTVLGITQFTLNKENHRLKLPWN
jgi:hypothetical protein